MKKWFLLLLLVPAVAVAQDTCGLKKSKDPFTNLTKLSTGFKNFDGGGLSVSVSGDATPTEIDFFIWVKDNSKCFDGESEALVVFEGERSKSTFRNSGSMNCEGAFHFIFKNLESTPSWLKRMSTKRISSIKLINGKLETLITFTEEQKVLFQKMANCIATEAKGLRAK